MLLSGDGVTEDSYRQLTELLHTAGQSEQGWYIYDVWDSQDKFQRFVAEKLGPAIESTGAGDGASPQPLFFPIETLVKGPAL
jgi:hypothetical protein